MATNGDPKDTQSAEQTKSNGDNIQVGAIEDGKAIAVGRGATAFYQGLSYEEVVALFGELRDNNQPTVWDGRIPYLGLKAFQESDAEFFFGREELVNDLLQRVEEGNRFIVIAGPSGSGKSSVARAGLFYALREGRVEGSDKWVLATMSPKDKPIENLALALGRDGGDRAATKAIREEGQANPLALHEQVELLKAMSDDPHRRFILLVDQFEELFTQTKDDGAREAFIKLLTTATGKKDGRVIVLLSLRSDFVSNCALYPELREQINKRNQFQLAGAMEPRDLAKAITLPSLEVGAEIEPALVKQIIDDMKGEPGALPLMSFALRDLFLEEKTEKGQAMDMTLDEYLDHGGLDEALERHADRVFENFSEEQQMLAKSIFSKLITVGEGRLDTRRTAIFQELVPADADAAEVAAVVGKLAQEDVRLVTTSVESDEELTAEEAADAQMTITIAHEKLIDSWPWLKQLINENRDLIAMQNKIQSDATEWTKNGEEKGFLYRDGRLLNVEENVDKLKLNELSVRFFQASIDERQRLLNEEEARRKKEVEDIKKLAAEAQAREKAEIEARNAAEGQREIEEKARQQAEADASNLRRRALYLMGALAVAALLAVVAVFFFMNAQKNLKRSQAQSLQANSRALVANTLSNTELAQARLLAIEGASIADQIDSPAEKTSSAGLLFSLAYEKPIPYQADISLTDHTSDVRSVAWNQDGDRLASAAEDNQVIIWDTESWQPLATLTDHTDIVRSVAWRKDGSNLASASEDNTVIIWDTESWRPWKILTDHTSDVLSVAWNEDGTRLASGSSDNTIIIWDTESWQPEVTLSDHEDDVLSVAWNTDGNLLASASKDGTIFIWDTESLQTLATLTDHADWVRSVAWNRDSSRLASASSDNTMIIWDTESWQPERVLTDHTDDVRGIAWNGDASRLASASDDNSVIIWDTESWQPLISLTDHNSDVRSVTWNQDGDRLASASSDNTVIIWNIESWQPITSLSNHNSDVLSAVWEKGGNRLASASADDTIIIWDTESWQPEKILTEHEDDVLSVAWNHDGDYLASASADDTVIIWDTEGWKPLTHLNNHKGDVLSVAWNDDGSLLASASADDTILIWNTADWLPVMTLEGHSDDVKSVAWNADGSLLASASSDKTTIIWDTNSWQSEEILSGHGESVSSVAWQKDSDRLATASDDNTIIIWDTESWQPLRTLSNHKESVSSVAWNGDGSRLASASSDDTIIIWDTESWQPLATLSDHEDWVRSVDWNGDGSRLASASFDNTAIIWEFPDFVRLQCEMASRNLGLVEWEQYLPDVDYRCTCEQWHAGEGAPAVAPGCVR